jgi:prolyl oligopeptidase
MNRKALVALLVFFLCLVIVAHVAHTPNPRPLRGQPEGPAAQAKESSSSTLAEMDRTHRQVIRAVRLKLGFLQAVVNFVHGVNPPAFAANSVAHTPPPTRKDNVQETLHGVTIADPYRWLENQDSAETRAWIDAQNAYTHSFVGDLPTRGEISRRMTELMKVDVMNSPTERQGRYFYTARRADQDINVIHMKQGLDGKEETLIDPHPLSADHTTSVAMFSISDDGRKLLYGVRLGGADEVEVHAFDVDKRADLPDRLERARYSGVSITPDGGGIYYGILTPEGPRVRFHKMGTDSKTDAQIFGEGYDKGIDISPAVSEDGRYLVLHVVYGSSADKTEIWLQDLKAEKAPIKPIIKDMASRFLADIGGDTLFVQTNWNAPNGRVFTIDIRNLGREHWKDLVPESSDASIESVSAAAGKLFVNYLHNVASQVKIYNPDGKAAGELPLPAVGSVGGVDGRWNSREVFYRFGSFATPTVIYRYDVASGTRQEWSRTKVPMDPSKFEVKQVWYESKDKTRIPMFVVYAKGLKLDGSHPVLLTGYGGFNLSSTPSFSANAVLWAEHGGVYALANLRGGGEFGEKWHRAGMLQNKQNVFDDFISAAEWLVKSGYTTPAKLSIMGGSNGGLLVGAALTQRPDLFRAVVCSYPLLDMVRYHNFLVAKYWVPEYGSSDDAEQFKYIYRYSPYHNVKAGTKYPAVLLISGDSDTRVAPLHARKMTALLQASTGSDRPVLLHYDTKAGHSAGRSITKVIEDLTDEFSFLFWQLDVGSSGQKAAGK